MSSGQQPPPPAPVPFGAGASDTFAVELVGSDGQPIHQRPVNLEELLRQDAHTLPIGNGVTVRLEEYHPDMEGDEYYTSSSSEYDDDDESDIAYDDEGDSGSEGAEDFIQRQGPPPGTHEAGSWYDVLNELRRESDRNAGVTGEGQPHREGYSAPGMAVGRGRQAAVTGNQKPVATPMKLFPAASSSRPPLSPSVAKTATGKDTSSPQSRREVWAAFAPPADPGTNYKRVEYVSVMDGSGNDGGRRFRPSALCSLAMASYTSAADNGQRILAYGGVSTSSMVIQKELYEFSVLTGNWRRLEGRQFVPSGHMGHAMTVVEAVGRLVVVGGIGPCGAGVGAQLRPSAFADDPIRSIRAKLLFPQAMLQRTRSAAPLTSNSLATHTGAKDTASFTPPPVGFVPFLFDMSLSDHRWRAIQTAQPLPLAFHTAVTYGGEIYVFGGLTEEMVVSGQLIAIDATTYALRLVQAAWQQKRPLNDEDSASDAEGEREDESQGPGPRFLHSAVRYGNYMIVYGGFNAHNEACADTWAFDLVNERWEKLRCHGTPPARAGHTASLVGSRMLVVGGFACPLDEAANSGEGEEVGGPETDNVTVELNLVPTMRGEYVWREEIHMRPALPPLVFCASAPCGDDGSIVVYGGLTKRPKRVRAGKAVSRSRTASSGARGHSRSRRGQSTGDNRAHGDDNDPSTSGQAPFLEQLITLDDAVVMTFPPKRRRQRRSNDSDAPHVNELGVEVDPNEMPESFKTFVRRQEDFLKKKEAAATSTQKKLTLEEQEAMEPAMYFTDSEIERVLEKCEELCGVFVAYPMKTLPGNVPDRERRIHIVEECVSLSRQVRDVAKSMKGSQVAVTAVKSKSHRRRAGQKFEDFSAAKPFRRVVIASLVSEINTGLDEMHRLNKALRTVEWEEKEAFKEAVQNMQDTVNGFMRATNAILGKYVNNRIEKLMKGVDKHNEVMRLLTEVVERNHDDKLWGRDEAREKKREAANAAIARQDRREQQQQQPHKSRVGKRRSPSAAAPAAASAKRRLGGVGYHADAESATVNIPEKEWEALLSRAGQLEANAASLEAWCTEGMKSTILDSAATTAAPPGTATTTTAAPAVGGAPGTSIPSVVPPPVAPVATRPSGGSSSSSSDTDSDAAVKQPPVQPPAVATTAADATTTTTAPPPAPAAASPKEVLVRRSNANREKVIAYTQRVTELSRAFAAALEKDPSADSTAAAAEEAAAKSDGSDKEAGLSPAVPPPDAAAPSLPPPSLAAPSVPPPPQGVAATTTTTAPKSPAASSSSGSSSSSSSSSSSGSPTSSAPPPAPAAVAPPVTVSPPVPTAPQTSDAPAATTTPPAAQSPPAPASAPSDERGVKKAEKPATPPPAVPPGYRMIQLSVLHPLLEARELTDAIARTVPLIVRNEWPGDDISAAPSDEKAVRRFKRVSATLTGLVQGISASFLAAAGAKKRRVLRTDTAAAPKPAKRSASRKAPRRRDAAAAPTDTVAPQRGVTAVPATSTTPAETNKAAPSPSASPVSAVVSPFTNEAAPLPNYGGPLEQLELSARTRLGEFPGLSAAAETAGTAPSEAAPLVSYDSFLKAQAAQQQQQQQGGPQNGRSSSIVVDVAGVVPSHQRVARPAASSTFGSSTVVGSPAHSPLKAAEGAAVISIAAGPSNLADLLVLQSHDTASSAESPMAPLPSSIDELHRMTVERPPAAYPTRQEQPATSVAPGPFVVNPDYFHAVYAAPPPPPPSAPPAVPVASRWADCEEDYFYFGQQKAGVQQLSAVPMSWTAKSLGEEPGIGGVGARQPPSPPPAATRAHDAALTVSVSPAVGTVLGSERLNAALVTRGRSSSRSAARQRHVSTAREPRSALAGGPSGVSHVVSGGGAQSASRPGRDEERRKRYTPGELQIMQGRERLSRRR